MKKVLIVEPIDPLGVDLLREHVELVRAESPEPARLARQMGDIWGVILRTSPFTAEIFRAAPKLAFIARTGVGYENIDMAEARARGVRVILPVGCNAVSVAEHALTLMLMLAKKVVPSRAAFTTRDFHAARAGLRPREITGRTVGIVGFGRIGQALARICRAGFDMRVLTVRRPSVAAAAAEIGAECVPGLEELLGRSDFVSLSVPVTPENRHLIGARQLAAMKPTAFLVNTARGPVVDEAALIEALRNGTIAGAGLDVFDPEPPALDNPLLALDNVVATPHVAGYTQDGTERTMRFLADCIIRALNGDYSGCAQV